MGEGVPRLAQEDLMDWLNVRIPPPLIALILGAAMWGAARPFAPLDIAPGLRLALAFGLTAAGLASGASGLLTFRRTGANIDPVHIDRGDVLVTEGAYRWTRNPMYLGAALILCGYAVYLGRLIGVLGPVIFVAYITRFQILPEERAMLAKFGARFQTYCSATRRWL